MAKIDVKGTSITVYSEGDEDFISLTDMLKAKDGDFFISDWLRNRNTVEFIGIWEQVHNPNFNYGGFAAIKTQAGLNNYKLSVKEWVAQTNAISLMAKAGRYGGTYAHKDIAFEFGMWISAEFKIYLIKEFQRLKEAEYQQLGWDIRRNLARINYRIHTDAIKANLIPPQLTPQQINLIYASEADLLNMALFGKTAKQWRDENAGSKGNIRDEANAAQLVCLANLETLNAHFIHQGRPICGIFAPPLRAKTSPRKRRLGASFERSGHRGALERCTRGPTKVGIGQRKGCRAPRHGRLHPATGSHLAAQGTAPPFAVALLAWRGMRKSARSDSPPSRDLMKYPG